MARSAARRRAGRSPFAVGSLVLVAVAVFTYLGFTRDIPLLNQPWEISAAFRDSSGIKPNSPVRIAGVEVGKVTKVQHTEPGSRAVKVTMSIKDNGRPLHADATAKIRPRIFLEGNFFVDLRAGTPDAPQLDEGDTIPAARTSSPVQFDQVLTALRSDTRGDLRRAFIELGATQRAGGGRAFNRSLVQQPDAYRYSAIVSEALLGRRPGDLGDWIRDQGRFARALDADRGQLRNLVTDFNRTAGALAAREGALRDAVDELPSALRAGIPAFVALDDAFPDVRAFAAAARPGVRSTGPAARALLPLVRELRGAVRPAELRGLSRDLRRSTPPLARLSRQSVPVLSEARLAAGCTNEVLVPFGNQRLHDAAFPATGPVHEELVKFLPGLAGESRSFDGNGQWFKVLGTGGAETLNLGNGLFGSVAEPIAGNNPPPVRQRPPLRPDVPCETQEPPDLGSTPKGPPQAVNTGGAAARARTAKAQDVAVAMMRRQLRLQGSDVKVLDRAATLDDVRAIARRTGLTDQLDRTLKRQRGG